MDFSPVCTQEHCAFGPALSKIAAGPGTLIFGVSCDSPFSHAEFKKKYNIPYDLLADPTRKMVKAYGMWAGEEPYNCTKRGTVIVGKDGSIVFYHEQPMKEARTLDDLAKASLIADELANRADDARICHRAPSRARGHRRLHRRAGTGFLHPDAPVQSKAQQ